MREILFRGKKHRKSVFDKTDWVYGSLIDSGNHDQVAIYPWINGASTMSVRQLVYSRMEGVKHETVGQYTGLTDKNGKKIFEGDVVLYPWNDEDKPERFTIKFKDGHFVASPVKETDDYWDFMVGGYSEEMEIIGNIHDNPELLQAKEE